GVRNEETDLPGVGEHAREHDLLRIRAGRGESHRESGEGNDENCGSHRRILSLHYGRSVELERKRLETRVMSSGRLTSCTEMTFISCIFSCLQTPQACISRFSLRAGCARADAVLEKEMHMRKVLSRAIVAIALLFVTTSISSASTLGLDVTSDTQ